MMLRSRKKLTREISMYEKIGTDQDGRDLQIMDILECEPMDVVEDLENRKNIRKLKNCICEVLDEREFQVICERYGLFGKKELPQREIAQRLGISRSYVSRLEKRALGKLKKQIIS